MQLRLILVSIHLFCFLFNYSIEALGTPIKFESISVEQALARAKVENKFVFVDVYAEWCRPCKVMEQEVFTVDSVGDYYNENFISLRVDAEKQQLDWVKNQNVEVFPTLIYYDPEGRKVLVKRGALSANQLFQIGRDLVNLPRYHESFQKKESDPEIVLNYALALKQVNEGKAYTIARNYLNELPQRKYTDEYNWQIIKEFLLPWDRVLFKKITTHLPLIEVYPVEYQSFIRKSLEKQLNLALDRGNSAFLRTYKGYVNQYASFLSNPDSLSLIADVFYTQSHEPEKFPTVIHSYVELYEKKEPLTYASWSTFISDNYYQPEFLKIAEQFAYESLKIEPTVYGHLAMMKLKEKEGDYRTSYAHLLLAYQFTEEDEQDALDQYERKLKVNLYRTKGVTLSEEQGVGDDGRFTLGAGMKRLMYGYPIPKSTSHFIAFVDGKLASNSSHFPRLAMSYLTGKISYDGSGITPKVDITYNFMEVEIKQSLIPVDKDGNEILGGYAQYYKISYSYRNLSKRAKRIGLGILFDTMIDDNDYCTIAVDGHMVDYELGLKDEGVPSNLLFFRSAGDSTDMMGAAKLRGLEATPPDKLVIGRWPVLYNVLWDLNPVNVRYGDSAYFLKWENRLLSPQQEMIFTTYYGLPEHKDPKLRIIMEDEAQLTMTQNVYFEHESSTVDLNAKMALDELARRDDIEIMGVLLNGFADIKGGADYNFTLSKKRIEAVGKIFSAYDIAYVPKPYGFTKSKNDDYTERYGNAWDRRVEVVVYYKLINEVNNRIESR